MNKSVLVQRFRIGNGVSHPTFGVGEIYCYAPTYFPDPSKPPVTDKYWVKFDARPDDIEECSEAELTSVPSRGQYINTPRRR